MGAGTKKVQQDLAAPGVVERFMGQGPEAAALRTFFAGLWSLDDFKVGTVSASVSVPFDL